MYWSYPILPCGIVARTFFLTTSLEIAVYRAFSVTCPASVQIYWNKRKRLHKKRFQLPQDWYGTPIWPPWRRVKTLHTSLLTPLACTIITYKITKIVGALWLARKRVCMSVCNHGCDFKMFCFSRANHATTNLKKFLVENSTSILYLPIPSSAETWKIITKHAVSISFSVNWHFKREKSVFWKTSLSQKKNWWRVKDFVFKTSCTRLRDYENFSFNQCHNKEFQLAIFSVDISTKKFWSKVCVRKGLNI